MLTNFGSTTSGNTVQDSHLCMPKICPRFVVFKYCIQQLLHWLLYQASITIKHIDKLEQHVRAISRWSLSSGGHGLLQEVRKTIVNIFCFTFFIRVFWKPSIALLRLRGNSSSKLFATLSHAIPNHQRKLWRRTNAGSDTLPFFSFLLRSSGILRELLSVPSGVCPRLHKKFPSRNVELVHKGGKHPKSQFTAGCRCLDFRCFRIAGYSIPPTMNIVRGQVSYSISGNIQYSGAYHTISYC